MAVMDNTAQNVQNVNCPKYHSKGSPEAYECADCVRMELADARGVIGILTRAYKNAQWEADEKDELYENLVKDYNKLVDGIEELDSGHRHIQTNLKLRIAELEEELYGPEEDDFEITVALDCTCGHTHDVWPDGKTTDPVCNEWGTEIDCGCTMFQEA